MKKGFTLWFTGMSASGKSTLIRIILGLLRCGQHFFQAGASLHLLEHGQDARLFKQPCRRLGGLSALSQPVDGPFRADHHRGWVRARVVMADGLDESPVTGRPRVGDHHSVAGLVLGTYSSQSNLKHVFTSSWYRIMYLFTSCHSEEHSNEESPVSRRRDSSALLRSASE